MSVAHIQDAEEGHAQRIWHDMETHVKGNQAASNAASLAAAALCQLQGGPELAFAAVKQQLSGLDGW